MAIVEIDSKDLAMILDTIETVEKELNELNEENVLDMHDFTRELELVKRLIQGAIERSERKQKE